MLYANKIQTNPTISDIWLSMQDQGFCGDWVLKDTAEIGGEKFLLVGKDSIRTPNDYTGIVLDSKCNLILYSVHSIDQCREALELHTQPVDRMPDESLTFNDMDSYGYHWHGMLPVSGEIAEKLFFDFTIYALCGEEPETEAVIDEISEIPEYAKLGVMFGIEKSEWLEYLAEAK